MCLYCRVYPYYVHICIASTGNKFVVTPLLVPPEGTARINLLLHSQGCNNIYLYPAWGKHQRCQREYKSDIFPMGVFDVGYTSQLWFRRVGTWFKHMKACRLFQLSLLLVLFSAVCRHEATEKKLHVACNFCQATSVLRISCAIKIKLYQSSNVDWQLARPTYLSKHNFCFCDSSS